jgi:hypothetical protein
MSVSSGRGSSRGAAGGGRSSAKSSNRSAKASGTPARKRSSAQPSASGRSSSSPRTTGRQSASQRKAGRQTAAGQKGGSTTSSASQNGSAADHAAWGAIARIGVPAVTGVAGIAGGVLLGRKALHRDRTLLGIPVPDKVDLAGVTRQIGEAGKQFARLAGEIRTVTAEVRNVREKAEQIGKALG